MTLDIMELELAPEVDPAQTCLDGQRAVLAAWRTAACRAEAPRRSALDAARLAPELAHVSVLRLEGDGLRFRLAGTGLRAALGREARGLAVDELALCRGDAAWEDAPRRALAQLRPVVGRTRRADGRMHFWLRLPLSSDGGAADEVLCHDRLLSLDALADANRAARAADQLLRLDRFEVAAA
jgi:hypothetical protein